jgi:putative PEP-CTERM system TPR-repeat lipoprotein
MSLPEKFLLAFYLALTLVASNPAVSSTAGEYYETALQSFDAGNLRDAIAEVRLSLDNDPDNLPAVILAGRINLALKQGDAAETALVRAIMLGADRSVINPLLAEAYMIAGRYQELLDNLPPGSVLEGQRVDLLSLRARAQTALRRYTEAASEIQRAKEIDAGALAPALAEAAVLAAQSNLTAAVGVARKATTDWPEDTRAWYALGALLEATDQPEKALDSYNRALSLDSLAVDSRLARANLLIDQGDGNAASRDVAVLRRIDPENPRVNFLWAMSLEGQHDALASKRAYRQAADGFARVPGNRVASSAQLTVEAALSNVQAGDLAAARSYLESYYGQNPGDQRVAVLLARLALEMGQPEKVVSLLNPLLLESPDDLILLDLLARSQEAAGRLRELLSTRARILALNPSDRTAQAELARAELLSGQTDSGLARLLSATDGQVPREEDLLLLTTALLRKGDNEAASRYGDLLVSLAPENTEYLNLSAVGHLRAGRPGKAREALLNAARLKPDDRATSVNLARTDIALGEPEAAIARLEKLVETRPDDAFLALQVAQAHRAMDEPDLAEEWARKAISAAPGWLDAHLFLVQLLVDRAELQIAESDAREMAKLFPESALAQLALVEVLLKQEKREESLTRLLNLSKQDLEAQALYSIGSLQYANGAIEAARRSFFRAINSDGGHLPSHQANIELYRAEGKLVEATRLAAEAASRFPGSTEIKKQYAALLMEQRQFAEAEALYRTASEQHPQDSELLLGLSRAQRGLGKLDSASRTLAGAREKGVRSRALEVEYAMILNRQGDWAGVEGLLNEMLTATPGDPDLLNNRADARLRLGKSDAALEDAQRAVKIAPDQAHLADTLGWILVQSGRPEEGLAYLRSAAADLPANPDVLYHLGAALDLLGESEEAARQLRAALQLEQPFESAEQARRLLSKIEESGM